MNRYADTQLSLKTPGNCVTHSQAQQLLALGDFMGWRTQLIGEAPMLTEPVRLRDWLLVPAHEDNGRLPARTLRRIQTIYSQGLRPQGFVVVHEAPMQLPAPEADVAIQRDKEIEWKGIEKAAGTIVKVLGILALSSFLLPLGLVAGVVLLDPILIAVTEDGYWIEIDRWQV